jgi:RND family efflux transporter MFP subunit
MLSLFFELTMRSLCLQTLAVLFAFLSCSAQLYSQSVIPRNTSSIDSQGGLEPFRVTEVATAELGVVREIFVKRGEPVVAGMPLGRLDDEQQKVALKEAETEAYATGTVETARKEVAFNEKRVAVTRALVEDGKASPRELERYVMELEIASAKLRAQEESKQISKVRREKAALSLHDRTIRAPHDGIVDEIYRDEGEYIAGNSPSLVRLVDVSRLRATFMLPEELAEKFRNRSEAEIRLPSHAVVPGRVEYISPFASAEGRTIVMTVLIDNSDHSIRSAHCELVLP